MYVPETPINMSSSNRLTAAETHQLAREGKISLVDVVGDHLDRIRQRDGDVKAWAYLDGERALAEARRLDAFPVEQRGPMHGVIVGVKDMINTQDMPTEHGSAIYKGHRPHVDAAIVSIFRSSGALLLGKTHTTEFAFTAEGPVTRNPFDQERTPGGSSSGSAAAVADHQCHVAIGTQTGGSTIRPGSYNGIYSYKPTWGAVSREGLKTTSLTLDTPGFFARSVDDLQLLAKVLAIHDDEPSPSKPLSGMTFAYLKSDQWDKESGASESLQNAWSKSRQLLEQAGAKTVDIDLPSEYDNYRQDIQPALLKGETEACLRAEYLMDKSKLHEDLVGCVERSHGFSRKAYLEALDHMASLRPKFDKIGSQYDAIVTPSVPDVAPKGTHTGDQRFNAIWTALHVPVVNVPGFAGEDGMPIGLTLVAPRFHDERLLAIAKEVGQVWRGADEGRLKSLP